LPGEPWLICGELAAAARASARAGILKPKLGTRAGARRAVPRSGAALIYIRLDSATDDPVDPVDRVVAVDLLLTIYGQSSR
jgi:hypothetical protein